MLEKEKIIAFALDAGFDACGVAMADYLPHDAIFMTQWLENGNHAAMHYLERNFDKRTDVQKLVEGAKTVVVCLLNHYTDYQQPEGEKKIAKFKLPAVNYHTVIRRYLKNTEEKITAHYGSSIVNTEQQHSFCDTAPILERRWAERAGLGWIGKNKLLIHPHFGSFTNIGILVLNDTCDAYCTPLENQCGTCDICIKACPTGALSAKRMFNANICISYLTTATKDPIPEHYQRFTENVAFGCDECANQCPWNKNLKPNQNKDLQIRPKA